MARNNIPGGFNMNNIMRQAQKMQKQMGELKGELDSRVFESAAGGGAVKVTVNGKKEVVSIKISPEVVDADDVEMMEDLILTAVNEALRECEEVTNKEMEKLTGGLGLPNGLF